MAKGAADAGFIPAVAVIGDSTFTHSGMTGLLDAINDQTPITVMILDNATTAMTGGQQSAATGRLEEICLGLGVEKDHISNQQCWHSELGRKFQEPQSTNYYSELAGQSRRIC